MPDILKSVIGMAYLPGAILTKAFSGSEKASTENQYLSGARLITNPMSGSSSTTIMFTIKPTELICYLEITSKNHEI